MSALFVAACGDSSPEQPVSDVTFNIDASRITASGISSGAMMATQLHVAHSSLVGGIAMLAGGPYYCASGQLSRGLGVCIKGGDPGLEALLAFARQAALENRVDDLANLEADPVWLFHGSGDTAVHVDMTHAASDFYEALDGRIVAVVEDIPAAHGIPTLDTGAPCDVMQAPFLNDCDFDAAGALLKALYGDLEDRAERAGEIIEVPQPGATDAAMLPHALAYIPEACASGKACGVHIAFHGCRQSTAFVGDAFASGAGYNEWADSNSLIILYPQVDSSRAMPLNPLGCWDWWGYTSDDYATKSGPQIATVKATLDLLAGTTL